MGRLSRAAPHTLSSGYGGSGLRFGPSRSSWTGAAGGNMYARSSSAAGAAEASSEEEAAAGSGGGGRSILSMPPAALAAAASASHSVLMVSRSARTMSSATSSTVTWNGTIPPCTSLNFSLFSRLRTWSMGSARRRSTSRGLMSRPGSPARNILRASGRAAASSALCAPELRSASSAKTEWPVSRSSIPAATGSVPLDVVGEGQQTSPEPWSRRNAPSSYSADIAHNLGRGVSALIQQECAAAPAANSPEREQAAAQVWVPCSSERHVARARRN